MNLHYSFKTDWKFKDLVVAVDRLYKTNNSSIIFALIWDLFQQDSRQRSGFFLPEPVSLQKHSETKHKYGPALQELWYVHIIRIY